MKKLLVILQNAYGVEKGYIPSLKRKSFINSHTGRRLKEVLPKGVNCKIINSNPSIGSNADSCFVPDTAYVEKKVAEIKPHVILACGQNAKKVVNTTMANVIVYMPHPAYRALSKRFTRTIKGVLETLLEK